MKSLKVSVEAAASYGTEDIKRSKPLELKKVSRASSALKAMCTLEVVVKAVVTEAS